MASLEDKVRSKLISIDVNLARQKIDFHPENIGNFFTELMKRLTGKTTEDEEKKKGLGDVFKDISRLRKLYDTLIKPIKPILVNAAVKMTITDAYKAPEVLRKHYATGIKIYRGAYHASRLFEGLREDTKKTYGSREKDMETGIRQLGDAFEAYVKGPQENDKIVKVLTKVAEEKGLEAALTDESINGAVKTQFPTADSYREFQRGCVEAATTFRLGELYLIGVILGDKVKMTMAAAKAFEPKIQEMAYNQVDKVVEERITQIYGTQK